MATVLDLLPVVLLVHNNSLFTAFIRYQGYISAALVLGGVDTTGPHLYSIYPHGSSDRLPYVTMGSGSLAAMAVFEQGYKPNMEVSVVTNIWYNILLYNILLYITYYCI